MTGSWRQGSRTRTGMANSQKPNLTQGTPEKERRLGDDFGDADSEKNRECWHPCWKNQNTVYVSKQLVSEQFHDGVLQFQWRVGGVAPSHPVIPTEAPGGF